MNWSAEMTKYATNHETNDAYDLSEGYIADRLAEDATSQMELTSSTMRVDFTRCSVEIQDLDCAPLAVEGHGMRWVLVSVEEVRYLSRRAMEATYRYVGNGKRK
jgi:hypothetical protein